MRFHPRKIVTYVISCFALIVVVFNLYNREIWVYETEITPWGNRINNAHIRSNRFPQSNGKLYHDHIKNKLQIADGPKLTEKPPTTEKPKEAPRLWLEWNHFADDRIVAQMRHRSKHIVDAEKTKTKVPLKTILLHQGVGHWNVKRGQEQFKFQECPVQDCELTGDISRKADADAVMFHHSGSRPPANRPINQVWILYMLESPYHTPGLAGLKDAYNWTATYRHDSTIVAPYEKFVPHNPNVLILPQNKSYAAGKTKKVAWFVSNCGGRNGRRQYASELSKYIDVDIYGACGPLKCPRHNSKKCFDLLNTDYKFYLAFENSNCRDYITEKFFVNGLG